MRRLANGNASEYNFKLSLVSLIYLVAGTVGLLLSISLAVVFSCIILMPRRDLGSHVCCSHMIEPLCQVICDVIHCNLLPYNLTSVLTCNTYSRV